MATLLERTRKINKVLQRFHTVEYNEVAIVLSNVINANTYIVDVDGKIRGYALQDDFECDLMMDNVVSEGQFPRHYVNWLNKINETSANLRSKSGLCAFVDDSETKCKFNGKNTTIVPIYGVDERIGTLVVARYNEDFTNDDLLLAEYGAAVVGIGMLHERSGKIQEESLKYKAVKTTLKELSVSEEEAIIAIFRALGDNEGTINASQISDDNDLVSRSVIVSVLKKLKVAGIVIPKSQGMKGTHIQIKNEYLLDGIRELAREKGIKF